MQEREGWHTFSRGDRVRYTFNATKEASGAYKPTAVGLRDGERAEATVYGVVYHEKDSSSPQGRKFLVLHDVSSSTFFSALWTRWQRIPKGTASRTFDVDDDVMTMQWLGRSAKRCALQ